MLASCRPCVLCVLLRQTQYKWASSFNSLFSRDALCAIFRMLISAQSPFALATPRRNLQKLWPKLCKLWHVAQPVMPCKRNFISVRNSQKLGWVVISTDKPLKSWRVFNLPLDSLDALKLPIVSTAAAPANTSAAAAAAVRAAAGLAARARAQPQPARPVSLAAVNPVRAHIAEVRSFFFILLFKINPNPKSQNMGFKGVWLPARSQLWVAGTCVGDDAQKCVAVPVCTCWRFSNASRAVLSQSPIAVSGKMLGIWCAMRKGALSIRWQGAM